MIWGIVSVVLSLSTIIISITKNPGYDIQNKSLSYMGTVSDSALIFNIGMILSAVVTLVFFYILLNHLKLSNLKKKVIFFFAIFSCLALMTVGFFPYTLNLLIHMAGASGFFLGMAFTIFLVGIFNLKSKILGFGSITASILSFAGLILLTQKFEGIAIAECFYVGMVSLWTLVVVFRWNKFN